MMLDSRDKKQTGPAGMPGAKGGPGESISAPVIAVSPKTLTVNEGGSASFQCSVSGNPKPAINWSKRNSKSQMSRSVSCFLRMSEEVIRVHITVQRLTF